MADEPETDDGGVAPPDDGTTAIAISLNAASREKADHFLEKQSRYLELQMEDLHEQRDLTLSHLKWRRTARAQYRISSTLDLNVADKAELARDMRE